MGLRLIIVRHGAAGDRELFRALGKNDDLRPLELKGERDIKRVRKVLRRLVSHVDVIATSPLVRAQQTAQIISESFPEAQQFEISELRPDGGVTGLLGWLKGLGRATSIMIVGHEPQLSRFLSYVLTGNSRSIFDIKKGGFAILEWSGPIAKKDAKLKCFLQPSQLKKSRKK